MKMKHLSIPLDDETRSRHSAKAASCGVSEAHLGREILRAVHGVRDPVHRVFEPPLRVNGSHEFAESLQRPRGDAA
jgi:hypothetical protein